MVERVEPSSRSGRSGLKGSVQMGRDASRVFFRHPELWLFMLLNLVLLIGFLTLFVFYIWETSHFAASATTDGFWSVFGAIAFISLGALLIGMVGRLVHAVVQGAAGYAVYARMQGRPVTMGQALRRSLSQTGVFLRSLLVTMALASGLIVISKLAFITRIVPGLSRVSTLVGAFAYTTAAFFVPPIIVIERESNAIEALARSVETARRQWGRTGVGALGIHGLFIVPLFAMGVVGLILLAVGGGRPALQEVVAEGSAAVASLAVAGLVIVLGAILAAVVALPLANALSNAYRIMLYRSTTTRSSAEQA